MATDDAPETTGKLERRRRSGRPLAEAANAGGPARDRLIRAALPLFAMHGYDSVSTGQIARAAGLSQPMVHYHFTSKEMIWYEAMETLMRDLSTAFPSRREELQDLDPVPRLKVLTRRFILMSAADPTLSRIIVHESLVPSARLSWLVQRYVSRGLRDFDEAIREGVETGAIKPMPDYAVSNTILSASSFTFCLAALVRQAYEIDLSQKARIQEMADTIVEILFHGLATRS